MGLNIHDFIVALDYAWGEQNESLPKKTKSKHTQEKTPGKKKKVR